MRKSKERKVILLVLTLTLFITTFIGCTNKVNTLNKTNNISKESVNNEVKLLEAEDMDKISVSEATKPFQLWLDQTSRDYTYREVQGFDSYAPIQQETAKANLSVSSESEEGGDVKSEKQITFNRILAPNDYLATLSSIGNYGLRAKGYVKYDDKGMETYRFTIMADESKSDQIQPEQICEEKYSNGNRKFMLLGLPRNEIGFANTAPTIGYEGKGLPEDDTLELQLIKTIGVENYLKLADKAKYIKEVYKTKDNTQYQYILDNKKLFDFIQLIYDELAKQDNKLYKEYLNNLSKIGLNHENGLSIEPFDYEYTVNNLLQSILNQKELKTNVKPILDLKKKIQDKYSDNFDNRLSSISMIIGKVGKIEDGAFVEGKEDTLRHIRRTKYYTDYFVYNTTKTYIDYDTSPDAGPLEESIKELNDFEIKKEVSKYLSDKTLSSIGRSAIMAQLGLDTNLSRKDIENKIKKIGLKMETNKELKEVESPDIYANLYEDAYVGLDEKASLDRKWTVDPVSYWINQNLTFSNQVQDYGDEYPVTFEADGLKFNTIEMNKYNLNNIYSDEFIEKIQNPTKEEEQGNTEQLTNKKLIKAMQDGIISNNTDYDKLKMLNEYYGNSLYELKVEGKGTIGDLVEDKTKPTIIMFGEHWCGYCRATMKFLNNKKEFFDKYNYIVLTTGEESEFKEDPEADQYSNIIKHISFNQTPLKEKLNIRSYPTVFTTDKDGNMVYLSSSITDDKSYEEFVNKINSILPEEE